MLIILPDSKMFVAFAVTFKKERETVCALKYLNLHFSTLI